MISLSAIVLMPAQQPVGRLIIAVSLRFVDVHEAMMGSRIIGPPSRKPPRSTPTLARSNDPNRWSMHCAIKRL